MAVSNEKQPRRMVIFAQDIIHVHDCSASSASRRLKEVKAHYEKSDCQEVTIKEYCDYYGLPFIETCHFLNLI